MNKKNILVATLGKAWQLVPELIGFTNPGVLPLYRHHTQQTYLQNLRREFDIKPVDALWIILTDQEDEHPEENSVIRNVLNWQTHLKWTGQIKFFILRGVPDLTSADQVTQMRDLIYRVVLHARYASGEGRLLLSLVGGRKTMSADMQQAGHLFGCEAMLHVIDNPKITRDNDLLKNFTFLEPLPPPVANAYLPVIISSRLQKNMALELPSSFTPDQYPLETANVVNAIRPQSRLAKDVEKRLSKARNLMYNFYISLSGDHNQTNYRALYALSPVQIQKLQQAQLGLDESSEAQEIAWLQRLPKAELHCHFGGILNAAEMIETAQANQAKLDVQLKMNLEFSAWLNELSTLIENENVAELHRQIPNVKDLRNKFPSIPEPFTVVGFLFLFKDKPDLLKRFIFGEFLNSETYYGIGIENYEALGDLQGSALMQSEESIRTACRILIRKCEEHNVRYLEVRQSPLKYTKGGLSPIRVVNLIREELQKAEHTQFKAIFIASRHGKMSEVYQNIELAKELFANDPSYRDWIVGFDLAGAESARKPSELREAFLPLMKESMNITIHAGENETVQNIWEAVYHLNADRIGHGLTLNDNPRLRDRLLDHKVTIEMCPSSNVQIVGYSDKKPYPLKEYLTRGLRVTVNTDNPGISQTDFSKEYYRAAQISPGGLSRWEIIQLIRNAFRGAFLPFKERQKLLLDSEKEIMDFIQENNFA